MSSERESTRERIREAPRAYGWYRAIESWIGTARQLRGSGDPDVARDLLDELASGMLDAERTAQELAVQLRTEAQEEPERVARVDHAARAAYSAELSRLLGALAAEIDAGRRALDGAPAEATSGGPSAPGTAPETVLGAPVGERHAAAVRVRLRLLRAGQTHPFAGPTYRRWARGLRWFRLRREPPHPRSDEREYFVLALECRDEAQWEALRRSLMQELRDVPGGPPRLERLEDRVRLEVSSGYGVDEDAFVRAQRVEERLAGLALVHLEPPEDDDGFTLLPSTYPECFEPD
ncbi:MAG: hypothetical protein HS104_38620 [Polyangiaceae bacterium]|nr:hypothetical protein [Polyangiaceae bacterium]